jgi:outer membrane lipoprotein carrier protein
MRLSLLVVLASSLLFGNIALPENFQAEFTQKITNTKATVIHYSGKVNFSNKTLFKWSYETPTKKEVCSNGLELLVVDHDLEQVSVYLINKGIDIAQILKNAQLQNKNIYVAEYENKKYTIQTDNQKKLHSIAYFDDLDNKVQIVFKHMKYGKGYLPASMMRCDYPNEYGRIEG